MKYEVWECDPDFEFVLNKRLFFTDSIDKAHAYASQFHKSSGNPTVVYQPKRKYLHGGYGWGTDEIN